MSFCKREEAFEEPTQAIKYIMPGWGWAWAVKD